MAWWMLVLMWGCAAPDPIEGCSTPSGDLPAGMQVPTLHSVDRDRSEMWTGHLLGNQGSNTSWAVAYDRCGTPVWWSTAASPNHRITRTRMGRDRRSVLYAEFDESRQRDLGRITRVDLPTGEVTVTRAREQHHDFVERPDGTLAWLAWERTPNLWFENSDETELLADAVWAAPEGIGDEVEPELVFSTFRDLPVEPFWSCSHMAGGWANGLDWTHGNSLVFHDDTAEWTLNLRQWDATVRLDPAGAFQWMAGGPLSSLQAVPGTTWQQHGHMSEAWDDRLLLFDNGNHRENQTSRVVEFQVDPNKGTLEEVWSFVHPDGRHISHLGDARRLPGGNTLISWSPEGRVMEVTPEGDIVWEIRVDQKIGRVEFVPDWSLEP